MMRRDRLIQTRRHDPYKAEAKMKGPAVCSECGAVYRLGRWHWGARHRDEPQRLCPACRRIAEACPAGIVTLDGPFVAEHRAEILGLLHHEAKMESGRHPLNRVMSVTEADGALVLETTEPHLADRLGRAVVAAYAGELTRRHARNEAMLRVHWHR